MYQEKEVEHLLRDKKKASEHKNWKEVANICNYLGLIYSSLGNYSEAIKQHEDELSLCKKIDDTLGIAVAHRRLGECYSESGSFRTSLSHLKKYFALSIQIKNGVEVQRAQATLGRTYFLHFSADTKHNFSSLEKAENSLVSALELTDRLKKQVSEIERSEMKCRLFLNLALVYEHKNNVSAYFDNIKEAISLSRKYKFKDDLYKCLLSLGNFYQNIKDYSQARECFDETIKTAKELKNKVALCEAFICKATALVNLQDFHGAKHYFKQAFYSKSHVDEDKDKAHLGYKTIRYIIKILKEVNKISDLSIQYTYFDKLGDLFVELKSYSLAIEYYKRELECALKLSKSPKELAVIYVSLAQTHMDDNQLPEALIYFNKELECHKGFLEETIRTKLKIIEVKILQKIDMDRIIEEYEDLLKLCNNDKLKKLVLRDFKYYLDSSSNNDKRNDIEVLLNGIESDDDDEQDNNHNDSDNDNNDKEVESDGEISELTSNSEEENEETSRLRVRKNVKKCNFKCNEKGETPLHRACIENKLSLVEKLVERGHPINPRDNAGWLPIHEAANHGYVEIVNYLIKKGAHVNDRGGQLCNGTSPLHDACTNGHLDVIRVLIRAGASVVARDDEGNTPLDCLREYKVRNLEENELDDYTLLEEELMAKMKEDGFDFDAKTFKIKRQRSPDVEILHCRRNRNDNSSPPRKIGKSQEAIEATIEYKQVMKDLRRATDGICFEKKKAPIKGLVEEMVDDWLEDDIQSSKKSYKDLYEMKEKSNFLTQISKRKLKNKSEINSVNEFSSKNQENDELMDFEEFGDIYDEPVYRELNEQGNIDEKNSVVLSNSSNSKAISISSSNSCIQQLSNISKSEPTKLLVKVHIDGKVLLMAVPNSSTPVSWLIEQTVARIHQMKQMRPIISLATQDGALLCATDAIGDVAINNEVHAVIETWNMEPLSKRYEDNCKTESIIPRVDVLNSLKIAESSRILCLRNIFLEKKHLKALANALEHESKIKKVDIGFSNLLLELMDWVVKCEGLENICLEGTGIDNSLLSSLLEMKSNVSECNLDYNSLNDECKENLIRILNWERLKILSLRGNFITKNVFLEKYKDGNDENEKLNMVGLLLDKKITQVIMDFSITQFSNVIKQSKLDALNDVFIKKLFK